MGLLRDVRATCLTLDSQAVEVVSAKVILDGYTAISGFSCESSHGEL